MKTTIDVADSLLEQTKTVASAQKLTLKNLNEAGLRLIFEKRSERKPQPIKSVVVDGQGLLDESWEGGGG